MKRAADYVRMAKEALGDASMADRVLGEHLGGVGPALIAQARYGNMSDPLALKLAKIIPGVDAGELLMVARLDREKDPEIKAALESWASKTLAAVPRKAAPASGGMAAMVDQLTARPRRRAAAVLLAAGVLAGGAPSPAEAAPAAGNCSTLCIMFIFPPATLRLMAECATLARLRSTW